ncbi:type VI secretion system-associated protein TagO [Shewanella algidipiscicola]|uniref:Uncharacterized protein n=1 Tax=Shewanella algidipiscicola TaxID=614070 RepID=A0ABQ4PH03_9GAMM|nr:type VI secretion system-associated protein TagO [Shewanella algidipiscicola]GIU46837.1 hypothetical protein TUM4630_18540 [Shewanella algidipiscicola]
MTSRFTHGLRWITLSSLLLSLHAVADIEEQLAQCAAKTDKLERLICYDTLAAQAMNRAAKQVSTDVNEVPTHTAEVAASQTETAQTTLTESAQENFGKVVKQEQIDAMWLTVKQVDKDPYGTLKFSFENGQQWKQIDSRRFRVSSGDKVQIERAALGSFLLGKEGSNTTIRVKRIN